MHRGRVWLDITAITVTTSNSANIFSSGRVKCGGCVGGCGGGAGSGY